MSRQFGPWSGETDFNADHKWLEAELVDKISSITWSDASKDVERFLRPREAASMKLWDERFFLTKPEKMN